MNLNWATKRKSHRRLLQPIQLLLGFHTMSFLVSLQLSCRNPFHRFSIPWVPQVFPLTYLILVRVSQFNYSSQLLTFHSIMWFVVAVT